MKRRLDLSIGGWLGLGFGVAALLLVGLGGIGWAALARVSAEAQRSSERLMPRAVAAQQLHLQLMRLGIAVRTYVLRGEDPSLREYFVASASLEVALEEAEALPMAPEDAATYAPIPPLVGEYQRAASVLVELARRGADSATIRAADAELARARQAVIAPTEAFAAQQQQQLHEASDRIVALRQRIERSFFAAAVLAAGLFAVSALLTVRSVRGPAARMVAAARDLARGEWGAALALREPEPATPHRNELRELSATFGEMAARLQRRDDELRAHREELQVQNEELQVQQEELQVQQEELQAQNEQLRGQDEELRSQAAELKRIADALHDTDRRRSEFLAMLSHELRNPLSAILSGVCILERAEPGSARGQQARVVIGRQLQQLTRLVDDLLDLTRITRQKIRLRCAPLDLVQLLRNAADDHGPMLESRGIQLELDLPEGPIWVHADAARLAQVAGNLLQNAGKFTDRGGWVRIALLRVAERAAFRISDSGIGIDGETLRRLFQPFSQAERSLARTRGGLGLGLSLVKGLVELHGGTVMASSAGEGRGAEFVVELPLSEERPALTAPPAPPPARGRRVLLVDDNADAAESLGALLELAGHRVALAHRGEEGLIHAQREPPDAVLCDIGLPDIDGYEVARRFRANPALRNVVLVALSGYALDDDLRRAEEAGFDAHVAKPATLERLLEIIGGVPAGERESA